MKTIQELIDFFEEIPADRWTKNTLSTWADGTTLEPEKNCAFGHLNKHIHGNWMYNFQLGHCKSWGLVNDLGISATELIFVNNSGESGPKTNVINFLKKKQKELL